MIISIGGKSIKARQLGEGLFTTAYKSDRDVYLFSHDPLKKAILGLTGTHIPKITWLETQQDSDGTKLDVYHMPFYYSPYRIPKLTRIVNKLIDISDEYLNSEMLAAIYTSKIPESIISDIEKIYYHCRNIHSGRVAFDFHYGNFRADDAGNLILLDIVVS